MSLITYLNRVHFGEGVLDQAIQDECAKLNVKRPMIVTDKGVVGAGLVDKVLKALPGAVKPTIFNDTPENPTESACLAGRDVFRENACDGLIAVGGGSPIDLAKAVGILVSHEGPLVSFMLIEGGLTRIKDVLPPLIAIPTTAGTGSEVGRAAVIVLSDNRKLGAISPFLIPNVAICDPNLTLSLPSFLTAATGMDAVTHCVETYISAVVNPPADGIALEGLRLAVKSIRRATEHGADLAARRDMMGAALNGALAFQKGLGAVHAMSHALGGLPGLKLHHGVLNAILLPHVLLFNSSVVGHRYAAINQAMGLDSDADTAAAFTKMATDLGLPTKLGDLGVTEPFIEKAAPLAEKDHTNGTNPRQATALDYKKLMLDAL